MSQHQRHIRRRDAADAAGLGERDGADAGQLLLRLGSQRANAGEIEAFGNPLVGQSPLAGDLLLLRDT